MEKKPAQPRILSIGVRKGKSVISVVFDDNRIRTIDTNLVSFALLAAEGVPVRNAD